MTEYKVVIDQFHKYYDIHVKAFGVFLGITAVLFPMSLDGEHQYRNGILITMGVVFSLAYFVVLLCELTIINKLCCRRARSLQHLIPDTIEDDFTPAGRWSCYIFIGVIAIVLSGWGYAYVSQRSSSAGGNKQNSKAAAPTPAPAVPSAPVQVSSSPTQNPTKP
jgi:hypothetical protein